MLFSLKCKVFLLLMICNFNASAMETALFDNLCGAYFGQISALKMEKKTFQQPKNLHGFLTIKLIGKSDIEIMIEHDENYYPMCLKKIPTTSISGFFSAEKVVSKIGKHDGVIEERVGFQAVVDDCWDKESCVHDVDTFIALEDKISPNALSVFQFKFLNKKLSSFRVQLIEPATRQWYEMTAMKDLVKIEPSCDWDDF